MKTIFDCELPFGEALEYWKAKGLALNPGHWSNIWMQSHTRAFTIAHLTDAEILRDIRNEVDTALQEGIGFDDFKKSLKKRLIDKGWYTPKGEKAWITLPDGTKRKRLTSWRLETIFRTNLQTSYAVGRHEQMLRLAQKRPYWKYNAIMDAATRPTHAAQNGKIYLARHPYWNVWYPPNGFNCRCYVTSHTVSEIDDLSKVSTDWPTELPDPGWQYNPAQQFGYFRPEPDAFLEAGDLARNNILRKLQIDNGFLKLEREFSRIYAELEQLLGQAELTNEEMKRIFRLKKEIVGLDKKIHEKLRLFIQGLTKGKKPNVAIRSLIPKTNKILRRSIAQAQYWLKNNLDQDIIKKMNMTKIAAVEIPPEMEQRCFYDPLRNVIFLAQHADASSVVHEYGHAIENNIKEIKQEIIQFIENRRRHMKWEVVLRTKKGPEYGYKARFVYDYMGKVHFGIPEKRKYIQSTEILSMGMQCVYWRPLELYRKDPEMFDLILRVISGKIK